MLLKFGLGEVLMSEGVIADSHENLRDFVLETLPGFNLALKAYYFDQVEPNQHLFWPPRENPNSLLEVHNLYATTIRLFATVGRSHGYFNLYTGEPHEGVEPATMLRKVITPDSSSPTFQEFPLPPNYDFRLLAINFPIADIAKRLGEKNVDVLLKDKKRLVTLLSGQSLEFFNDNETITFDNLAKSVAYGGEVGFKQRTTVVGQPLGQVALEN